MVRTQVYLTEDLYRQIITQAKVKKVPMAKLIRNAIKKGLESSKEPKNDLIRLSNLKLQGGPKDLSQRMDEYLYGTER